ncbi:hypothetical protein Q5752_003631 [Cryptotrichosporon argae]
MAELVNPDGEQQNEYPSFMYGHQRVPRCGSADLILQWDVDPDTFEAVLGPCWGCLRKLEPAHCKIAHMRIPARWNVLDYELPQPRSGAIDAGHVRYPENEDDDDDDNDDETWTGKRMSPLPPDGGRMDILDPSSQLEYSGTSQDTNPFAVRERDLLADVRDERER